MSAAALARAAKLRGFKLGQTSVSRILELKQAPTLSKVYEIAQTLDLPVRVFLTDGVKDSLQNVVELPPRYPKIFGKKSNQDTTKPKSGKKLPNRR